MALAADASVLMAVTASSAGGMTAPVAASGRRVVCGMSDCERSHGPVVKPQVVTWVDVSAGRMKVTHGRSFRYSIEVDGIYPEVVTKRTALATVIAALLLALPARVAFAAEAPVAGTTYT